MNLAPTPEQQAVREQARKFLSTELTRERRLAWDGTAEGHDAAFWDAVAELGWFGFALPERHGGQGGSLLDLGLLLEECGRAVAPHGLFAAMAGGIAVAACGSERQQAHWLPRVASRGAVVALAVAEAEAAREPAAFTTRLARRDGRLVVTGEKRWVLQGVGAEAFLVAARDGDGVSLVLVPRDASGVRVTSTSTLGKDRQSTVTLADVSLPADAICGEPGTAWPRLEALRRTLVTLLCAELAGGCEAVLVMTVRHVTEREQFGMKLGALQAVQQMVAAMAIQLEGARHVARQALWRISEGVPAEREVAIAKAWTARAYREIALLGHQLHGGAGYVVEHELHRHSLRAKEAELLFGSTEEWLEDLADHLALGPSAG